MRSFIYRLLQPGAFICRPVYRERLRVLAYHDVKDSGNFDRQIEYLKNNFSVISLDDLISHFESAVSLPQNPVLITFDDGDVSVYNNGMPVLKRKNVPAVLFIITELIGSRKAFWWKRVESAYRRDGKSYQDARKMVNQMKGIPNSERLALLSNLQETDSAQLSVAQLKELTSNGISAANHTHTHPMLNVCTNDEIRKEMRESLSFFRMFADGHHETLAYPNGNFDLRTEGVLRDEGIRLAFLFDHKVNARNMDPMRISRIRVNADEDLPEFKVKVSGLHSLLNRAK